MNYLLSQIFLCLLAAFVLGAIIGWLWRHITCKKCQEQLEELERKLKDCESRKAKVKVVKEVVEVEKEVIKEIIVEKPKAAIAKVVETPVAAEKVVEKTKKVVTESNDGGMPTFLSGPRGGKADDLKRIKGVGKVLEGILFERGVYHFDQISSWSDDNAKWMDTFMKFPGRIEREDWIAQAKLLATGAETEFSKKVDKNKIYD